MIATKTSAYLQIPIEKIEESSGNPRKTFDKEPLSELADSILQQGVLQPLVVRPAKGGTYELVIGARRLRAAKLAKLTKVPCIVRSLEDDAVLQAQLVENAQRVDVSPLEEADAYRRLIDEHNVTVDAAADKTGKSKAWVYARLKLLELGKEARAAVEGERISPSTALVIARLPEDVQDDAVKRVAVRAGDTPMPARAAAKIVRNMAKDGRDQQGEDPKKEAKDRRRKKRLAVAMSNALIERVVEMEHGAPNGWAENDLRIVALLAAHANAINTQNVLDRRGVSDVNIGSDDELARWINKLPAKELRGLVVELMVNEGVQGFRPEVPHTLKLAAAWYGVDVNGIAAKVKRELAEKRAARKAGAS